MKVGNVYTSSRTPDHILSTIRLRQHSHDSSNYVPLTDLWQVYFMLILQHISHGWITYRKGGVQEWKRKLSTMKLFSKVMRLACLCNPPEGPRMLIFAVASTLCKRTYIIFQPSAFDSILCSYREACLKHGLLEDDIYWNVALTEAVECKSSREMWCLFCVMLAYCSLSEPFQLWEVHEDSMSEDFLRRMQAEDPLAEFTSNGAIYNEILLDLPNRLQSMGREGSIFFQFAPTSKYSTYSYRRIYAWAKLQYLRMSQGFSKIKGMLTTKIWQVFAVKLETSYLLMFLEELGKHFCWIYYLPRWERIDKLF